MRESTTLVSPGGCRFEKWLGFQRTSGSVSADGWPCVLSDYRWICGMLRVPMTIFIRGNVEAGCVQRFAEARHGGIAIMYCYGLLLVVD